MMARFASVDKILYISFLYCHLTMKRTAFPELSMIRHLYSAAIVFLLLFLALPAAAGVQNISAAEARTLLMKNDQVLILDVRTPGEYRQVRLAAAQLIPIDQLSRRLGEIPTNRPVLLYCAVGYRSAEAANFLARQGFPAVYNMYGGISAWQLRGYPVQKGN
jgi:phage shock protein E